MNGSGKLALSVESTERIFMALIGLAIVATATYVHNAAALTFPVPSGDEGFMVWQSCAFARANTFIAPEVDPTRPILLLPFVYYAIIGAVFKVLGCSIEVARGVSLVFVLASVAILAVVVRRATVASIMALVLIGAFFLNPRFVIMANAIRMEPVFLAFTCWALLLVQRGQVWLALAVLSITPMIHPNGVLYLVPVLAYGLFTGNLRQTRPDRWVIAVFIVSALIWAAHGIYVLRYWDGFMHDTAHRLGEAATVSGKEGLAQIRGWRAVSFGLIVAVALIGRWRKASIGYWIAFAVGAWMHGNLRREEPYEAFADFTFLLIALAVLQIVGNRSASAPTRPHWLTPRLASNLVALSLVIVFLRTSKIDGPINYIHDLTFSGMQVQPRGAYFRDDDYKALQTFLKSYRPDRSISVEVYPWSDAILMADFDDRRVQYHLPFFDPLFRPASQWIWGYTPTESPVPDLYIVRVSRYTPPHLRYRPDSMFARALRHPGVEKPEVIHSRDSTEIWYGLRAVAGSP